MDDLNDVKEELDDIRRCLYFDNMFLDRFVSKSLSDEYELDEYLLTLVSDNVKNCKERVKGIIDRL